MSEILLSSHDVAGLSRLLRGLAEDRELLHRFEVDPPGVMSEFGLESFVASGVQIKVSDGSQDVVGFTAHADANTHHDNHDDHTTIPPILSLSLLP
jgi:hypothetical protein